MAQDLGRILEDLAALPQLAAKNQEYADLAGIDADEGGDVYGDVLRALGSALDGVKRMRDHAHRWNADLYCDECGADGAA